MSARVAVRGLLNRVVRPKTTVRWRLTLLYGGLFLASGVVLLAITYTLVDNATVNGPGAQRAFVRANGPIGQVFLPPSASSPGLQAKVIPKALANRIRVLVRSQPGQIAVALSRSDQRVADLHQLVEESAIALAVMTLLCGALGWVVAGRVLRPLRTMTATTQGITEANLNHRLAMTGPRDELRQLADTIDGLLGRLEGAFEAQRGFVANASHELRTPLTAVRALLEMVISDPSATVETFRATCEQVLEESAQEEQLIDALLTLAQGQHGLDRAERLDLSVLVGEVLTAHRTALDERGLRVESSLESAPMSGDARLLERLVSNLLDNAIRHNVPGGHVHVGVASRAGKATLIVANTGPQVPVEAVERLLRPFQRLAADRIGHGQGVGLGLSIVSAVAVTHGAELQVRPGAIGGLEVTVAFAPTVGDADTEELEGAAAAA